MNKDILTKSDFMLWRSNPRHLWAKKNGLYQSQPSLFARLGQEVENLAQQYLIEYVSPNLPQGKLETQVAVTHERLHTRIDALLTEPDKGTSLVFEIKSGNKVTSEYVADMAFQALVLKNTYQIERYFLVLLNKYYTRAEELNPAYLFQVVEVTREIKNSEKEIANQVEQALAVLKLDSPQTLPFCDNPESCPCPHICHEDLPEYSVYDMAHLPIKFKRDLRRSGIISLTDIPTHQLTHARQQLQQRLTAKRTSYIDRAAVAGQLNLLIYPIYFLDYEACNLPIPHYPGHWPYCEVVFQFSLHQLDQDGHLEHHEFLHLGTQDPSQLLIQTLRTIITQPGTIVAWNKNYETRMHNQLARLAPEHLLFLLELNQRMYDLRDVFSKGFYVDYRFKGKTSLKSVLPVMVPELNYSNLAVNKGDQASRVWYESVFTSLQPEQVEANRQSLLEYCKLDTLAMVEIYQKLQELAQAK